VSHDRVRAVLAFLLRYPGGVPRVKPHRLHAGAVLGVVAPASPLYNRGDLARAASLLAEHGFQLELAPHWNDHHGYLAGDDAARADDFMRVWCDPRVNGVICLRGGYGSARIVDRLDYDAIAAHPKPFIGFSDITALHLAIGQRANLVTFYGPMIISLARPRSSLSAYSVDSLIRAIADSEPLWKIQPNPDDPWLETINGGVAEGELVGGCLSLLAGALGTRDDFDWRGKIVFLEDVNEEPFRIDHNLNQLLRAGKFEGVAGLVLSEHAGVGPRDYRPAFPSTLSFEDVLDELIRPLGLPTLYNLPLGHGRHMATVPLGVQARLDATAQTLEVLEGAVSDR
jgi:muramoyltetrapeptide carboxypeptidase